MKARVIQTKERSMIDRSLGSSDLRHHMRRVETSVTDVTTNHFTVLFKYKYLPGTTYMWLCEITFLWTHFCVRIIVYVCLFVLYGTDQFITIFFFALLQCFGITTFPKCFGKFSKLRMNLQFGFCCYKISWICICIYLHSFFTCWSAFIYIIRT